MKQIERHLVRLTTLLIFSALITFGADLQKPITKPSAITEADQKILTKLALTRVAAKEQLQYAQKQLETAERNAAQKVSDMIQAAKLPTDCSVKLSENTDTVWEYTCPIPAQTTEKEKH